MPVKLERHERTALAIFGVIVVVIVALVFFVGRAEDDPGYPSSTSAHSRGALAAFMTLQESGYDIQRWERPPAELPSDAAGSTLILAQPFYSQPTDAKAEIARFIANGGRVLAIGSSAASFLPRNSVIPLPAERTEWKSANATAPSRLTRGGPITTDQAFKWDNKNADEIVHFASDEGPLVVSFKFGKGEVIWWASSVPLMNGGIQKPGNLELFTNSVGDPGTHVYWDEYFHSTHHSLYATVSDTPLKFLAAQFLLFAAVVLVSYSRRSGPLRTIPTRSRLSPLEFIEMLGALYGQFKNPRLAVEVADDRFRHVLMRRTGVKSDAEPEIIASVLRDKLHVRDEHLLNELRRIRAARYDHELSEAEALRIVQLISQYQSAVLGTGKQTGEH